MEPEKNTRRSADAGRNHPLIDALSAAPDLVVWIFRGFFRLFGRLVEFIFH